MSRGRRTVFALVTLTLAVGIGLGVVEVSLRVLERVGRLGRLDYPDVFRKGGLAFGGGLQENFRGRVVDGQGGTVRWHNNAAGFRYDREVEPEPPAGVLRILSVGDSFTAGYRVDQEQTFSHRIERGLVDALGPTEVLIAAVEDPAVALDYLERFGLAYHPHVVLLGITLGNDIAQTYIGLDPAGPYRLSDAGGAGATIEPNPRPPTRGFLHGLEAHELPAAARRRPPLARRVALGVAKLRLLRFVRRTAWPIQDWYRYRGEPKLFDPVHGLGFYLADAPAPIEEAYARLDRLLGAFDRFCRERGIALVVALFPQRFQVQEEDWRRTVVEYGLEPSAFDRMAPNRRIVERCRDLGLTCIDPTEAMHHRNETAGESLYLPLGDMHWNAAGHAAFYEASIEPLVEVGRRERRRRNLDLRAKAGRSDAPARESAVSTEER